ncbi:MAG: methyltransferase domain-containing protein [Candidatus Omnitrophica bacterium]|nr:methyltransferase domain-containing protein [Candidatus Omnitrophota bacterium]MDD5552662.1 methyltransferase domain-containing protein [Candidatus Omnitrophota bacterium]
MKTIKLNLGCGQRRIPGFTGVDNNPNATAAQVTHNLESFPYPFEDNSVDEILMDHILEHLESPINILIELYRICKDEAQITLKSPHFSCNWLHPGHKSGISTMLFGYFDRSTSDFYGDCRFKVNSIKLRWLRPGGPHGKVVRALGAVVDLFANLHPGFCQRVWCYWVGGFEEIEFVVTVQKAKTNQK